MLVYLFPSLLLVGCSSFSKCNPPERLDCESADLSGADLSGANLSRANLTGASLTLPNLMGATMPDGTIHD
jgi:uncharacterized protein YjbI with pentapeptide repeats